MAQGKIRLSSDSKLAQADIQQLANELRTAFRDAQRLQQQLNKLASVPGNLNRQLRTLSQGSGLTPGLLALQRGVRADQRATPDQLIAAGLRDQVKLQDQLIQGARARLSLDDRAQKVDLRRINQMRDLNTLKAAELKAAQAVLEAERKGSADLDAKKRTLLAVQQQKERILQAERETNRLLAEQQRRQRALAVDTLQHGAEVRKAQMRQLLGDKEFQSLQAQAAAQARRNLVSGVGAASLLEVQSRIMLNFIALNSAFRGLRFVTDFVVQLDAAMRNLQAITDTTETEMAGLRDRLIEVSEKTKFTAVEVTEAAVTLGQAGFSTQQIKDSIEAITLLATATGTDLNQSVDTVTSAISVFNLQASEATNVANLFTAALNESKLNMDKLALGIQYAGNVAAQSGANITEVTAALAAFANSGVRSGSTLGTGLRHLFIELQNPTEKFKKALDRVGLSLQDVDVRSQGFVGVMKNLRDAGFTAADGIKVFEVRSAAAFAALSRDVDSLSDLEQRIILTRDAIKANDVQLKSLSNTAKVFTSVMGTLAADLGGDVTRALQRFLGLLNETFSSLRGPSGLLATIGNIAVSGALAALSIGAFNIFKNLSLVEKVVTGLRGGFISASAGAITFRNALLTLGVAVRTALPFFAITAGLTLLFTLFGQGADEAERLADKIDQAGAALNEASGKVEATQTTLSSIADAMAALNDRAERLRNNGDELKTAIVELESRFRDLGFAVDENNTTFDELIAKLQQLHQLANLELQIQLRGEREALQGVSTALQEQQRQQVSRNPAMLARLLGLQDRLIREYSKPGRGPAPVLGVNLEGLPEPLLRGFNLLTGGRIPSVDEAAVLEKQVEALRQNTEIMDRFGVQVERMLDLLNAVTTSALEAAKNEQLQRQNTTASQVAEFEGTRTFSRIQEDVLRADRVFDELQRQIAEQDTAAGRDAALKQGRDALYAVLGRVYGEIQRMAAEDPESLGAFQRTRTFQDLVGLQSQLEGTAEEVAEMAREAEKLVFEGRKRVINNELAKLQKDADNRTSQADLQSIKAYANELYSELAQVEKEIISRANFDDFSKNLDLKNERFAEIDDQISEQRENFNIKINDLIDESIRTVAEFDESIIEGVKRTVEDAKKAFKRASDQARSPLQVQQARIEGLQSGVNTNQVPESVLFFENKRLAELETAALSTTIPARQKYIDTLIQQKAVVDEQVRAAALQVELLKNERFALDAAGAGAEVKRQKQEELNQAIEDHNKALNQQVDVNAELAAQQQENLQDIEKLSARTNEHTISLHELFKASAAFWIENNGLAESSAVKIDRAFQNTFTALRDGTREWLVDFTTATNSAGDAFASFGRRVLETIANIAANEVSNQIWGFLVNFAANALPGLFGATPRNTGPLGPGGAKPGTQIVVGGPRAAGGPVVGGIPNRDSVLTPTMPGEFVVRKAAVDAVGVDFMHALNSGRIPTINNIVAPTEKSGGPEYFNLYVVTPDQKPVPGPRDIIAQVANDLATPGSATNKLVKRIMLKDV